MKFSCRTLYLIGACTVSYGFVSTLHGPSYLFADRWIMSCSIKRNSSTEEYKSKLNPISNCRVYRVLRD
jgi:hypothetical protein